MSNPLTQILAKQSVLGTNPSRDVTTQMVGHSTPAAWWAWRALFITIHMLVQRSEHQQQLLVGKRSQGALVVGPLRLCVDGHIPDTREGKKATQCILD